MSIFPNPNNGEFYISPNKIFENGNLTVINPQGKKVFETKIIGNLFENVSVSLSPGIYFVMIRNCENVYTEKVIVY
nr:T9SS type A sorting domain-containing protein [Bacteroidota bacterium]